MTFDKNRIYGRKAPSLQKTMMMDTWRGVPRIRRWPRKRKKKPNPKTAHQMEWFRQANQLAKYIIPEEQAVAWKATQDSPLLPRDIQLMAMAGTLFSIQIEGEGTIYPMQAAQAVSDSLNTLGQTTGDMLVRGPEMWYSIPAGNSGQVLTSQGPGNLPTWSNPTGSGGAPAIRAVIYDTVSESSTFFATKGGFFIPAQDTLIYGIAALVGPQVVAESFRGTLATFSGTSVSDQITAIVAQSPIIPRPMLTPMIMQCPFDNPVLMNSGQLYAFLLTRTNGTPTSACPIQTAANNGCQVSLMGETPPGTIQMAQITLAVGQSPDAVGAGNYGAFCLA